MAAADVGGDPAVLVHDDGVEVVGGVLGDVEGLSAEGTCEEAFGLGGVAVDAGVAEEFQVVLDGALLVKDVVDGVEEAGGLGAPAFGFLDDVCGDGLESVAACEAEAVAAGGHLHGAVGPLDDDDGLGGDALVFALELVPGHLAGDGVGVGLELWDAVVDAEVAEGDVVDPDVGALQQFVEVEDGGGGVGAARLGNRRFRRLGQIRGVLPHAGLRGGFRFRRRPCGGDGRGRLGSRRGFAGGLGGGGRFGGGGLSGGDLGVGPGDGGDVALGIDDGAVGHEVVAGVGAVFGAVLEEDVAGGKDAVDLGPGGGGGDGAAGRRSRRCRRFSQLYFWGRGKIIGGGVGGEVKEGESEVWRKVCVYWFSRG